ncbi:unnamed protein product [Dracunculus medinensis]|uniref:FIP1-like 1 protein n=1 Tax=Dracunculus medinensis TaxID=318479 RepID=A0A0N4U1L1_DRAME|nr:unnamed protein product [Dracunculus medinensis]
MCYGGSADYEYNLFLENEEWDGYLASDYENRIEGTSERLNKSEIQSSVDLTDLPPISPSDFNGVPNKKSSS